MTATQLSEDWPLDRLLGEVMGSGPKSADDMTRDQATAAMHRILDGTPDPTTLGAFLLANRWKGNTPTELAAFVDVLRDRSVRVAAPSVDPVDCGANYDGKTDTAVLGVAAGVVAAAAGQPVVVHSADRVPGSYGVTYRHVLDRLGVVTALAPDASARMVEETGFGFYDAQRFSPAMGDLLDRRAAMGVRTFFNTIETLTNPADAAAHLGSFYHLAFANRVIETAESAEQLRFNRVVMLQGLEGYDDVRPGQTTVAESANGQREEFSIVPDALELAFTRAELAASDVAAASAAITSEVLCGDRAGPVRNAVLLNAALRLYAGGTVASIVDGVERAREAVDSGAARGVLEQLQRFEPSHA